MIRTTWTFFLLLSIFSTSSVINSFELAVSTKNDIKILKKEASTKVISFPNSILALGSDLQEQLLVIQPGISESQLKVTTLLGSSSSNQSSNYISQLPGAFKVLPDPFNGDRIFISNQSLVISENQTKVYQGQKILDLALDFCQRSLFLIDNGRLFRSNLDEFTDFQRVLPSNDDAILVTRDFYLAKNPYISHSEGFVIKHIRNGHLVCKSAPSKEHNIRDVVLIGRRLYLLDALNFAIWTLDVEKTKTTCDLNLWERLNPHEQLLSLAILHIGAIDCISQTNGVHYYGVTADQTTTTGPIGDANDDPCHNFCFHGKCTPTSLNKPICHCDKNFSGDRCETETCHNFCLNGGECNISSFGIPDCKCVPEFTGSRCEILKVLIQDQSVFFYYEIAFYVSFVFCVVFLIILLFLCIMYIRSKRTLKNGPTIVRKSTRTRVFSTSSSSGKRSRSVSKSTSLATGNVNEAFKDSSGADSCIDGKDHMCQALISDDGVVLDLEDCCNMTICDKPCIEASFRKPTSRKKPHQKLTSQDLF